MRLWRHHLGGLSPRHNSLVVARHFVSGDLRLSAELGELLHHLQSCWLDQDCAHIHLQRHRHRLITALSRHCDSCVHSWHSAGSAGKSFSGKGPVAVSAASRPKFRMRDYKRQNHV